MLYIEGSIKSSSSSLIVVSRFTCSNMDNIGIPDDRVFSASQHFVLTCGNSNVCIFLYFIPRCTLFIMSRFIYIFFFNCMCYKYSVNMYI